MHSVRGVAGHITQVHVQRVFEVLKGVPLVTYLGGDDALHAGRQRRVAGGQRVVVLEVAAFLVLGELVLSLTTEVYSSGPVTPWMWNLPSRP